jgi:hypothetical protein
MFQLFRKSSFLFARSHQNNGNEQKAYVIQVDFMDKQGKDIAKRLDCATAMLLSAQ